MNPRCRLRAGDDRGSVLIGTVVLVMLVFVAAGLVYDGGHKLNALAQAQDIAANAARAGGQEISESIRIDGQRTLDPTAAEARAHAYLASTGHQGTVAVTGDTVTVTVTLAVPTLFLPGPVTATATGTATAVGDPRP